MQKQDFDLRIFSDLLNTEATPGRKVSSLGSFEPELSLPLVQSSFAKRYIVKAIFAKAWAMATAVFLAGFGASVWIILVASIRQRVTPNTLLGRVYSASRFISWGVGSLGAALAAALGEVWGIHVMFAIGGAVCICLLLLFPKLFPTQSFSVWDEATEQA